MHGDITRSTFDATKDYSSVRHQQGRVQIDADLNEQRNIELHDERELRKDVIGKSGAPLGNPGMEVVSTGAGLDVGAGRYYVDGIRCDNDATATLDGLPTDIGHYIVFLDVWERPITAIEDPSIREVALGGPDTATRTKVTCRPRLLNVDSTGIADPNCTTGFAEWDRLLTGSTGAIEVRAEEAAAGSNPCLVPESAGYRGLENRLYRVQIHGGNFDPRQSDGSDANTPTFKWSRDNGSTLASWVSAPSGVDVAIDRAGSDA